MANQGNHFQYATSTTTVTTTTLVISSAAADGNPEVPAAAQPLTADTLKAVPPLSESAFALDLVHDERVRGESTRLLVVGAQAAKAPYLCTTRPGADVLACGDKSEFSLP